LALMRSSTSTLSNATPPTIRTALTISRPQIVNGMPRICRHTIFICGNSQRYGKPLKQRGVLPRSGGHSSSYWYHQLWNATPGVNFPWLFRSGSTPEFAEYLLHKTQFER
jgi:hypothetical protein